MAAKTRRYWGPVLLNETHLSNPYPSHVGLTLIGLAQISFLFSVFCEDQFAIFHLFLSILIIYVIYGEHGRILQKALHKQLDKPTAVSDHLT